MENVQEVPLVISAAYVLQNFCLIAYEGSIEEFLVLYDNGDDQYEFHYPVPGPAAVAKRNQNVLST